MMLPPILLTSSVVAMDSTVLLKDQELRIFHTIESIQKWEKIAPNAQFVICDGSGFDFSDLLKSHFPYLDIECLFFMNDSQKVHDYGKGYGEGEIIRYALEHSVYLHQSAWFAKCTAKLWVDNFLECVSEWNGQFLCKAFFSHVFSLKKTQLEYIDTRFYLINKRIYEKLFSSVHFELSGQVGASIEENFLEVVLKKHLKGVLFKTPPIISGVGGGSGKYYNTSMLRRLKETLRSRIVSMNQNFKDLFYG